MKRALSCLLPLLAAGCLFGGGGGGGDDELDYLPESVLGGSGGSLSLEVEANQPALLRASFAQYDEEADEEDGIYSSVVIEPGTRTFRVDVPNDAYIYFELGVPDATVGATLEWTLHVNGQKIWKERDQLEEPLGEGYAFFLQIEADDLQDLVGWTEYEN